MAKVKTVKKTTRGKKGKVVTTTTLNTATLTGKQRVALAKAQAKGARGKAAAIEAEKTKRSVARSTSGATMVANVSNSSYEQDKQSAITQGYLDSLTGRPDSNPSMSPDADSSTQNWEID